MSVNEVIMSTKNTAAEWAEAFPATTEATTEADTLTELFGEPISCYSRAQAIDDGMLVDLSTGEAGDLCREAGIRYPLAMTAEAWAQTIGRDTHEVDGELVFPSGQDYKGRLWDVCTMMKFAIRCSRGGEQRIDFRVSVWDVKRGDVVPVALSVVVGPADDGEPCLTVMLPHED